VLERSLEILVRLCASDLFSRDWTLIAQQLSLPSGRLDLLFIDGDRRRQLVELKKGRAGPDAIEQVLSYADDVSRLLDGVPPVPWVVAHEIPNAVAILAASRGVRTLAADQARCEALIRDRGLTEADLLGARREGGVLHGGGAKGGLRSPVDNSVAFLSMPDEIAAFLTQLEKTPFVDVRSGGMQTVIHYRGVKLGGVNRKHRGGVGYISEGVVLHEAFVEHLHRLGFRRMTKTQVDSGHEHIWWEISSTRTDEFEEATRLAREVVDRALHIEQVPIASSVLRAP
jgi:hypothetical protein